MNTKNFIAAAVVFLSTATAFAAEAPAGAAAAAAATTASTTSGSSGSSGAGASSSGPDLNLPALGAPSRNSNGEAKAEALEFVKNYKTALAVQLDQYKN